MQVTQNTLLAKNLSLENPGIFMSLSSLLLTHGFYMLRFSEKKRQNQ